MSFRPLNRSEGLSVSEPGKEIGPAAWRKILLYDVYLLVLLILAARLATCLHEIVGHGLTAVIFGGRVNGIHISLFGGGWTYYHFDQEIGPMARFLVAFGGILVNAMSGLLALWFVRRGNPARLLFLAIFAAVSVLGATGYTILGFYYQQGDPVAWMQNPFSAAWLWIPFLMLAPGASYLVLKPYVLACESRFPARTYRGRAIMVLLTLGLAGCLYAGLYIVTDQRSAALDAAAAAQQEDKRRVLRAKREAVAAKLREAHPELSAEAVRRMAEKTSISVDPGEVPRRFPLMPILAILYLGGVLASIQRGKKSALSGRVPPLSSGRICWWAMLAVIVLGVLSLSGGWLFKSG